jgi:hypothetical protein
MAGWPGRVKRGKDDLTPTPLSTAVERGVGG